jgi:sn-glycerol 3-phosphate transport system permease protein
MVENRPLLTLIAHAVLILAAALMAAPVWIAFIASTYPGADFLAGQLPLWPGPDFVANYRTVLFEGLSNAGAPPIAGMLINSLIVAVLIAVGKIAVSLLSAFAIVYFRFPGRVAVFWIVFITLMLPVEVRILPTFEVVANLGMLNSYAGLTIPLIASATATFLFRQFFMTIPDELAEAARIDGATPMRFFRDMLLPLSRTNIAALFVILFIYGWNQYLWPLLITNDQSYYTVVMGIQRMSRAADATPLWHLVMATTILALLPPTLVVIAMQRLFVKGLVETEK